MAEEEPKDAQVLSVISRIDPNLEYVTFMFLISSIESYIFSI